MGSRAYIAKIERDGTGEFLYLGHGCYPDDAGRILLEHYSEESSIETLMALGCVSTLGENVKDSIFYHRDYREDWDSCQPAPLSNGTDDLFGKPYHPGVEWLYCWPPDGWLAARVECEPPSDYFKKCGSLSPEYLQHWFDHNPQPEWVAWRKRVVQNQRPRPLTAIIEEYRTEREKPAQETS